MYLLVELDKRIAWLLRWGGQYTISAECGSRRSRCPLCGLVRRLFALLGDPEHCERHAREDGLIR